MREPDWRCEGVDLYLGDCLDVLPELPEGSVDSVVTDPPYSLSFMNRAWDKELPPVALWEAVLRVAKPGAMLLAFGGTRTGHRLVCAIEDAGWEVRDTLMWLTAQGFPKSLDIGKAIDKAAPRVGLFAGFAKAFAERRAARGVTQTEIAQHFPSKTGGLTGCVWNWENGANVPTRAQWLLLQPMLGLSDEWAPLIERVEAEREVVGQHAADMGGLGGERLGTSGGDITIPATDAAKLWDGWGTALKPAFEPICLAMKPLDGTFAENALKHGVAGLWIDGGRIACGARPLREVHPLRSDVEYHGAALCGRVDGTLGSSKAEGETTQGRFPANLLLSHHEECTDEACHPDCPVRMLDEQSGERPGATSVSTGHSGDVMGLGLKPTPTAPSYADRGGASRFFFCAKASGTDRGNRKYAPMPLFGVEADEDRNVHPTVKPLALMEYLCTLTRTPTGGLVLDPFMGSGTTVVACIRTGRPCIGIERDPESFATAVRRCEEARIEPAGNRAETENIR